MVFLFDLFCQMSLYPVFGLLVVLQSFSNLNVHMNTVRILLKDKFWLIKSRVRPETTFLTSPQPGDIEADGPLSILSSKLYTSSWENFSLLYFKIHSYLYFWGAGKGVLLLFKTIVSVKIVFKYPPSGLCLSQASDLYIQMLSGHLNADTTSTSAKLYSPSSK